MLYCTFVSIIKNSHRDQSEFFNVLVCQLFSPRQFFSPRILRVNWTSFGMMVTRLA